MITEKSTVQSVSEFQPGLFLLKVYSPSIAASAQPGQFCNIKVSETTVPLLRRPFSISDVEEEIVSFMFNIFGEGTRILAEKRVGETLNILGPLGHGFEMQGDYETAIFAAGGMGSAPFPFLAKRMQEDKRIISFVGGRSSKFVITQGLPNPLIATDDGSLGTRGNVVELLRENIEHGGKVRIFGCGPTPMLKALQKFALEKKLDCQLSTETAMACGFGICQGCPIESVEENEKYLLVCKDGPVFNAEEIVL